MDAGEKYTAMRELAALREENARLKDRADKAWDAGHIAGREKSPTMRENRELRDRAEAAEAERDEARAELVRTEKLRQQNAEYLERAEAEVARLEGLILDWSRELGLDAELEAEARRIRAAKGE